MNMILGHDPVQIERDPFARASLVRALLHPPGPCKWCGQPGRFAYGWQGDQNRDRLHLDGPFCSVGCYRSYHGQ